MTIFITALVSVLATVLVTLIVLNLSYQEKSIQYEIKSDYTVADPQFKRSMGQLLPPPLAEGNRVDILVNGKEIFPAMLEAIRGAQETISFETYIFWSGDIGRRFTDAMVERARAGVKVHVLVDWAGGFSMDKDSAKELEEAGAAFHFYHPLRWYTLSRANNRTHRKILVVDGKIAFTGGVGIADEWDGDAQDPEHYRDTHFRLQGPSVAQMQAAFMDNWLKADHRVLHEEGYFPPLEKVGDCLGQVFMSSPQEGSESMRLMFMLSIACSSKRILMENAYFVPDDLSIRTFLDAKRRGVDIQIIVPGPHVDARVTKRVSRSRWGKLLEAGIEIYEYQPAMLHCKFAVFDDLWSSAGSTNFDNRSFRLNDEVNINVLNPGFAARLVELFEADKANSRRITHEEWKNRPWKEKAIDHFAGLFRTQF